jgi:hypothetical protein
MTPWRVRALAVLVASFGLCGAAPADEPGPIRDDAGLFQRGPAFEVRAVFVAKSWSLFAQTDGGLAPRLLQLAAAVVRAQPTPVEQAVRQIEEIRRVYHFDLVIQTVKALPAEERKGFRGLLTRDINRRLAEQARRRAEQLGVVGVYLEICKQPRYVQVVVWPPDKERVFTSADREELRRKVARLLGEGKHDEALLTAVATVRSALARNRADLETTPTSLPLLGGFLIALVIGWVLLRGVRHRLRPAARSGVDLAAAEWQTRLGVPAGAWMADRVFLAHLAAPRAADPLAGPRSVTPDEKQASVESPP